jgi:hypothetical protein
MTPIDRRSGFASANGAQIYYEIAGNGSAVVLVHAGVADNRMWDDYLNSSPAKKRQGHGAMHHGLAVSSIGMAYRRFSSR